MFFEHLEYFAQLRPWSPWKLFFCKNTQFVDLRTFEFPLIRGLKRLEFGFCINPKFAFLQMRDLEAWYFQVGDASVAVATRYTSAS